MKDSFVTYLESVGMTAPLIARVEQIYAFYDRHIIPNQLADVFVSEYVDSAGLREYDSLIFFTEAFVVEAKQFVHEDDFDVSILRKQVTYIEIRKQDYDYEQATDASRLSVTFTLRSGITGEMKASRANCDHLRNRIAKHLVPNLLTE
jgi:hypothetical protein